MNIKKLAKKFIYGSIGVIGSALFLKRKKVLYLPDTKKILVISLYFSGDFLFHTAVLELLKKLLPGADIDVWIKSRNIELTENSFINEVLIFDDIKTASYNESSKLNLKGKFNFLKRLRRKKYDIIIDLTGQYSTALFTYFADAKYTTGINYNAFGFCYDKFVDLDTSTAPGHLIKKYVSVIKEGLQMGDMEWQRLTQNFVLKPYLYITEKERESVERELSLRGFLNDKPLITIHTTAGWRAKYWDPENFSLLVEELYKKDYNFIFVGGSKDEESFLKIIKGANIKNKDFRGNFIKFKFLETAELIRRSDVFIGSDSAPLHIAGAMDTPSIGLFGPTNPGFSNPIGEKHKIVYNILHCSATNERQYCTLKGGQTCATWDCMKLIKTSNILNLIDLLLNEYKR